MHTGSKLIPLPLPRPNKTAKAMRADELLPAGFHTANMEIKHNIKAPIWVLNLPILSPMYPGSHLPSNDPTFIKVTTTYAVLGDIPLLMAYDAMSVIGI
jgi:hypothetical protein